MMSDRRQSIAGCPQELWVQTSYVYGESDLVSDTLTGAMTAGKQFQIREIVVAAITVLVMNSFFWMKRSSQVLLHYIAMLKHLALSTSRTHVRWNGNPNVSAALNMFSDTAFSKTLCCKLALVFSLAGYVAELLPIMVLRFPITRQNDEPNRTSFSASFTSEHPVLRVFSLSTYARARNRTVSRISVELFSVRCYVSGQTKELFTTCLTLKPYRFGFYFSAMNFLMLSVAESGTKLARWIAAALVAYFDLTALQARHFDSHGYLRNLHTVHYAQTSPLLQVGSFRGRMA